MSRLTNITTGMLLFMLVFAAAFNKQWIMVAFLPVAILNLICILRDKS